VQTSAKANPVRIQSWMLNDLQTLMGTSFSKDASLLKFSWRFNEWFLYERANRQINSR